MNNNKTLGELLKKIRKEHGKTQLDLANKCNCSITSIQNYESNRTKPNSNILKKICETLEIEVDELLSQLSKKNVDDNSFNENSVSYNIFLNNYLLERNLEFFQYQLDYNDNFQHYKLTNRNEQFTILSQKDIDILKDGLFNIIKICIKHEKLRHTWKEYHAQNIASDNISDVNIGQNIKIIRKSKGITQQQLADKVGVTLRTIQNYENSPLTPNSVTLNNIANVLNVKIGSFLSGDFLPCRKLDDSLQKNIYALFDRTTLMESNLELFNYSIAVINNNEQNSIFIDYNTNTSSELLTENEVQLFADIMIDLLKNYLSHEEKKFIWYANNNWTSIEMKGDD